MGRSTIILLALAVIVATGCSTAITTTRIADLGDVPDKTYDMYLYSFGSGGTLRAAFLSDPAAGVEVVPFSVQISKVAGKRGDAEAFMRRGSVLRAIVIEKVMFGGRQAGYLMTYQPSDFGRERTEINLFVRGGKIFISASESGFMD